MSAPAPRILFAAPDESLIQDFYLAVPKDEHNVLAMNALDMPASNIIEYSRASSIEVIISRGGVAEFLREAQRNAPDAIPIVEIQLSAFDIIEAVREAREISRNMAFISYANMLDGIRKITEIFDLDVRFVCRSSPWDCLEAIFTALEHKAEVIVGDARVVKICRENKIPCVPFSSGPESLRQACIAARQIIEMRDNARQETHRMAAILDHLEHGLLALDQDGRVLYSNPKANNMAGMGGKRLAGLNVQQIPFLQRHISPSFLMDSEARTEFSFSANKEDIIARLTRIEPAIFGISGILALNAESGNQPKVQAGRTSGRERGHSARFSFDDIIGVCPALRKAKAKAEKYARADAAVLLLGRTGVGKELFAHAIHNSSPRRNCPFVAVNLAAMPATLIESELFGYVRGAFTDARRGGKLGVFEYAEKGTVFLDEIGEIPLEMQSRLLRVLQDGEFMRLGDDRIVKANCRIIAATNKNLEDAIDRGAFREDLYYRLNILRLIIPDLSERRADIRILAVTFLKKLCTRHGKRPGTITPGAMKLLLEREWNGNVRELQSVIERYVALCEGKDVCLDESGLREILEEGQLETHMMSRTRRSPCNEEIRQALEEHHGNVMAAATALGIHRATLWRRLKKASPFESPPILSN